MKTPSKKKVVSPTAKTVAAPVAEAPVIETPVFAEPPVETAKPVEIEEPAFIEEMAEEAKILVDDANNQIVAIQEKLTAAAEEVMAESHETLDKITASAEDLTKGVEASLTALTKDIAEFNTKAFDALRVNVETNVEHFKALFAAKSLPEAWQLQAEHGRKQFEALSAQTKELSAAASKFTADAVKPLKSKLEKALSR
jgi:phasin